jgi:cytochrome c biogenesis protein CcmG, thiol:disulfide interchange protein DsbE
MAKQEQMTPNPAPAGEAGTTAAGAGAIAATAGPAPGPPAAGPPAGAAPAGAAPGGPGPAADRSLGGWLRTRSRTARIVLTGTAALTAVVVILLVLGVATGSGPAPKANAPLRAAPTFSLAVLGHPGQHISLARYAGHPLVLNFFASWCTPCQRETPLIASFYRSAHGHLTILGVDVNDSASKAEAFTRQAGVSYPVVTDPQPMTTTLSYGVAALPATFFLNAQHRIVKSVYGAVTAGELKSGVAMMSAATGRG